MEIARIASVDETLARQLDELLDEDVTWDREQGARFLANPDNLLLVARWEGHLCGFLTAYRLQRFDRRRAEVLLYEIGVEEPFQRRGVATALIDEVKRWGQDVRATEMWVLTNPTNAPAMSLYDSTGGELDPEAVAMFTYPLDATAADSEMSR